MLCCRVNCDCSVQAHCSRLVWICCIPMATLLDLSFSSLSLFFLFILNPKVYKALNLLAKNSCVCAHKSTGIPSNYFA